MSRIVTLLTDFGTADSYTGELKGRLLSLAPDATIVDLSHDIAPGDVQAGAYVLGRAWPRFPKGTVHCAVVDPGVGTARRALAVEAAGHAFVGPDNGLLESALRVDGARAFALAAPPGASPTFHGRDLFAPAAAALALGRSARELGTPAVSSVRGTLPVPRVEGGALVGTVIHVDRFGTLVTNLDAATLGRRRAVRAGGCEIPVLATFGDVPPGAAVAFIGSGGTLEIAVRDGRADQVLKIERGAEISAA